MVLAIVIVIVVVVRVVRRLAVLMVLRRVMHVRHFMLVMTGMVPPAMAVRETLFGAEARDRRPRGTGQDIQELSSVHVRVSFVKGRAISLQPEVHLSS
jgi:hypothetical protein